MTFFGNHENHFKLNHLSFSWELVSLLENNCTINFSYKALFLLFVYLVYDSWLTNLCDKFSVRLVKIQMDSSFAKRSLNQVLIVCVLLCYK